MGEALGLADVARARGSSLGEAAWEYAAVRSAFRTAQLGTFSWTCPDWGEVVRDRGPGGGNLAGDEPGHGEGCQRLAAAVAAWLAQGG